MIAVATTLCGFAVLVGIALIVDLYLAPLVDRWFPESACSPSGRNGPHPPAGSAAPVASTGTLEATAFACWSPTFTLPGGSGQHGDSAAAFQRPPSRGATRPEWRSARP